MNGSSLFSRIFGQSPVQPLQDHMAMVMACIEELLPFFDACGSGDWARAEAVRERIVHLENEADRIKNDIRLHLPHGLFLAVSRRDLLDVLMMQDLIANRAKDITGLVLGRRMVLPPELAQAYLGLLRRSIDASRQAQVAVNELDELLATGFRGNEAERVQAMIEELHGIETETDDIQIKVRATLFALEKGLPPVDVIFMYKIIEWTGELADRAQSAGDRLRLMLAR